MNVYGVKELELLFKEQYKYAKAIEDADGNCICPMPVKSGKRIVMQILSQRSRNSIPAKEKHVLITALNRRDTKEQFEEHKQYGIKIVEVNRQKHIPRAKKVIEAYAKDGLKVVVHFDESDYGTGSKQLMDQIFETLLNLKCKIIGYSATNEEAEFSQFGEAAIKLPLFVPHPNYRGAACFLDNELVFRATPFYDNGLTEQGRKACEYFANSDKAISILRVVNGFKELENERQFYSELSKYNIDPVFVDANRSFEWSESYKKYVDRYEDGRGRTLLVICQTCSRSTEVGFHKHICFWHDYRNEGTAYNTMHQAFLRVAHYYKETENLIRVYAVPEVFELAANRITFEKFEASGYKLSDRIKKHSNGNQYEMHFAKTIKSIPDDAYFGEGKTKEHYIANCKGGSKISRQGKIENGVQKGNNLAQDILHGRQRGNNWVIHIDKANPSFQEDWDELKRVKPEVINMYAYYHLKVVPAKTSPQTKDNSLFQNHLQLNH